MTSASEDPNRTRLRISRLASCAHTYQLAAPEITVKTMDETLSPDALTSSTSLPNEA